MCTKAHAHVDTVHESAFWSHCLQVLNFGKQWLDKAILSYTRQPESGTSQLLVDLHAFSAAQIYLELVGANVAFNPLILGFAATTKTILKSNTFG